MRALAERLEARVDPIEAIGYDGDVVEAQCFAYLALRSRQGLPISLPTTTGAPRPLTGGAFWPAKAVGKPPLERKSSGGRTQALSTAQTDGPAAAKYKKTKQKRTASSP